jgi:hypothetical protein
MVGRYRLGHEKVALYIACVLFESIVNSKLGWKDDALDQETLFNKITRLKDESLKDSLYAKTDVFTNHIVKINGIHTLCPFSTDQEKRLTQIRARLDNFRWLRNQVMHGKIDQIPDEGDNKKEDLINYIWSELDPDSFNDAHSRSKSGHRIIDSLFEHTADYMVRAIDEIEAKGRDKEFGYPSTCPRIDRKDFDNLFELRRKLAHLKNYLDEWLPRNAEFLHTDVLTTIDTTSGYIWMPLVSKRKETRQSGIYGCSVSILATPLDLRIYMDFGGRAVQERKIFFDFLSESEEYKALAENYKSNNGLEVFDIDWYSSVLQRRQFTKWLEIKETAITEARSKLSEYENSKDPITWNRLLHGYIFSKIDLPEKGYIDFPMLEPQLRDIIRLFEIYSRYRTEIERKERKDAKRQKNTK